MLIKRICFAIMALVIMTSAGCGFKLQGNYDIPSSLTELSLSSPDEFSELTRFVRDRLQLNNVELVKPSKDTASLRILDDTLERSTLSLYSSGNVAEYELIYHVNFSVMLPNEDAQAFEVEIRRDYLDDPRTALAKSREMEMLVKEMRIQAADQVIQKLATIENN